MNKFLVLASFNPTCRHHRRLLPEVSLRWLANTESGLPDPKSMMPAPNLIIRSKRVVLPGSIAPASIHVSGDIVTSIRSYEDVPPNGELIDVDDESVVMPGLVDS